MAKSTTEHDFGRRLSEYRTDTAATPTQANELARLGRHRDPDRVEIHRITGFLLRIELAPQRGHCVARRPRLPVEPSSLCWRHSGARVILRLTNRRGGRTLRYVRRHPPSVRLRARPRTVATRRAGEIRHAADQNLTLRPLGLAVLAAAIAAPLVWLPDIAQGRDAIALFSQYLGMSALIAMAISQTIATRIAPVEWIFGGLDRAYVLHKWLGIGALVAILLHDTFDAEMTGLGRESLLSEVAETAGEIALYGFLILIVVTLATFVPYHLWRWTHRLMGLFFLFGAFHFLFILKPFAVGDPLGLYVAAFCVLGIAAFAWRLLRARMRPSRPYQVAAIEKTGGAVAITMTPTGRALRYRPGQFAFAGFGASTPHPFTISKAPAEDGSIRMTVARLGDFTSRLAESLTVGAEVRIEGLSGASNGGDPESRISGSRAASASRPSLPGHRPWTAGTTRRPCSTASETREARPISGSLRRLRTSSPTSR